jgi:hypothetical protein
MTRIYALIDPRDEKIRYVGKTRKTLDERLLGHQRVTRTHRGAWIAQLQYCGFLPRIELICEVPDPLGSAAEVFWIAYLRALGCDLVNGSGGGDGVAYHFQETREKISAALMGHEVTLETRRKLSEMQRGVPKGPPSQLHREHLSASQKGRPRPISTWETRRARGNVRASALKAWETRRARGNVRASALKTWETRRARSCV